MSNLIVKEVEFNGSQLMAAQDEETGKIYVGVRWVCDGLGLTKGQMQSERQRIQEDIVLFKGERKIVLPTKGGKQEVLCIELDFLPLWLAKISITPKMKKEQPELTERLIQYQLKAKDVLAAAFLSSKTTAPPMSQLEVLVQAAQALFEQDKAIKQLAYQQEQQGEKIKELSAKVKTIPEEYYSIAGYASLRGIKVDINKAGLLGRKASIFSKKYDVYVGKVCDPRFGQVNTYHLDILKEVFNGIERHSR